MHNYEMLKNTTVYELSAIQKKKVNPFSPGIESPFLCHTFHIKQFLHTFCQKSTFCYPTNLLCLLGFDPTFFESLITHSTVHFLRKVTIYTMVNVKRVVL